MSFVSFASPRVLRITLQTLILTLQTLSFPQLLFLIFIEMNHCIQEETEFQGAADLLET